jgi:hypothetical protein
MQPRSIAVVAAGAVLALAPAAAADGLPVLGIDVGPAGVAAPGGTYRYATIATPGGTLVERIRQNGGQVSASTFVRGSYTIPAVAYDGSAGGLSGDRRTLVLIEPRRSFPRATTSLLVLHVPSLRVRSTVHLDGDFSFDAVSPDGSYLYLIDYVSPSDPTRYAVRSYSVAQVRLLAQPIVDPREPNEKMRGNPISRVSSPGGRWAYTLYDGAGGTPFVHALDTVRGTARCIDLDGLDPATLGRLRLQLRGGGGAVAVVDGARELLSVDTSSYAVSRPHAARWWRLPAFAGAALAAALGVFALWLRRRPRLVVDLAP